MSDLFPENGTRQRSEGPTPYKSNPRAATPLGTPSKTKNPNGPKSEIEKIYSYKDALGREIYQVVRLKPKDFRQRHNVEGKWVWNMEGVERVLYRLPEVLKADTVWIVEGEKDADNLAELGFTATCNVGGAGKWMNGYTETLLDKHLVLCGDNDKPGSAHIEKVLESVASTAKSVRIVKIPTPHKDASDLIHASGNDAKAVLEKLHAEGTPIVGGLPLPVYSIADIEPLYAAQVRNSSDVRLDLGVWIPSWRGKLRALVPGELLLVIGGTGTGKTAILQNIAHHTSNLRTLFFEMEIPPELIYERSVARCTGMTCEEIEDAYRKEPDGKFGRQFLEKKIPNLFVCPESRLTLEKLEQTIVRAELRMGGKPALVLLDYVQLLSHPGSNRYERLSDIAEELKRIAKSTQTILVVGSQITRPKEGESTVTLHSAKDSGALENSAGLVIGAWRTPDDPSALYLKILKGTKGGSGLEVVCDFDGSRMSIKERRSTSGVPDPSHRQTITLNPHGSSQTSTS